MGIIHTRAGIAAVAAGDTRITGSQMSDTADMSTDDDINEQMILAAVDRLYEAVRGAKLAGAPLANSLFKRNQMAMLDALTAFFEERASELTALGRGQNRHQRSSP